MTDTLSAEDLAETIRHQDLCSSPHVHWDFTTDLETACNLIKQRDAAREAKLVEALRFYADEDNYKKTITHQGYGGTHTAHPIIADNGQTALNTLKELGYE